jgi:phosphoribosylformimino-5-aminoimidazole carboxamide ribotide isomerase
MLIPAIDLQGSRVVQLVQGERLALAFDDLDEWIRRFAGFPLVQVIDLDAAKGRGSNEELVRRACAALPCRVGGGIRTVDRAGAMLDLGAREIILGSALFQAHQVNTGFAAEAAATFGSDRIVAAVDSRKGKIALRGWSETIDLTPVDAVRILERHVGGFLYTIVDGEGLMQGIDMNAVAEVKAATQRRLTVAGGIRHRSEVDELHRMGVDAVVGMAVYTGKFDETSNGK